MLHRKSRSGTDGERKRALTRLLQYQIERNRSKLPIRGRVELDGQAGACGIPVRYHRLLPLR